MPSSACAAHPRYLPSFLHDALPILWRKRDVVLIAALRILSLRGHNSNNTERQIRDANCLAHRITACVKSVSQRLADDDHSRSGSHVDRKSTRLNSSHGYISYAVFCLCRPPAISTLFPTRRSSDLMAQTRCRPDRGLADPVPSRP